jgi:hypothetical protein
MDRKIAMLLAIISEWSELPFRSLYLFSESSDLVAEKRFQKQHPFFSAVEEAKVIKVLQQHIRQGEVLQDGLYVTDITIDGDIYYLGLLSEQPLDETHFQLLRSFVQVVWREKQATAEMMLHNQYQKQMVETISEGFMAIDKDGRIAYLVSPEKVGVF